MSRDLVVEGVCGQGHAIFGPADVRVLADGVSRCARCLDDMIDERRHLREAARERAERGIQRRRRAH